MKALRLKETTVLLFTILFLTGCATGYEAMYEDYTERFDAVNAATQQQEEARIAGLTALANDPTADTTARTVAAIALGFGQGANGGGSQMLLPQAPVAPRGIGDRLFDGFIATLPFAAQVFINDRQVDGMIANTQATRDMSIANTQGFVAISQEIQAPMAPQANVTTSTSHVTNTTHSTTNSYNPVTTNTTNDSTHTPTVVTP